MALPFKYICNFSEYLTASTDNTEEALSTASLDSLRDIIPEDIDFEKNIDLVGVAFNGALANRFNKNGDGIDSETAIAIKDYFIHKPTNIEHQRKKVVGHIVGSSLSSFGSNELISDEEALATNEPFNIALSAVIYKTVNPQFAELAQQSVDESSEFYHKVSASWEIGFNDYDIVLGSKDLKDGEVVRSPGHKEEFKHFLKAYGGSGRTEDGVEVHRLIIGNIYPLGIGFTANPAADVKGITVDKGSSTRFRLKSGDDASFEEIEIKNNIFEEKTSHCGKGDVILDKNLKPKKTMENEILKQVTETLEAQASSKKLSEEAIANITKVFHDAIIQKNEQWQNDKESMVKEREDLVKASEAATQELDSLKSEIASTSEEVARLQGEISAREIADKFNDRMSELDDKFELEDEDRAVLASDLRSLESTDEAYAEYKEKIAVMWSHKTKAFKEEQEKALEEKVEEQVQRRLAELSNSEAAKGTAKETAEEAAEKAIENAKAEEETIANNNGSSTEDALSLREKFKKAFSKDGVTIQY